MEPLLEQHPLALELQTLRASVARFQDEAHLSAVKLQRHSLDATRAHERAVHYERENDVLKAEIAVLRANPGSKTSGSSDLQVQELTLSLRRLSQKLTLTEEALTSKQIQLANTQMQLNTKIMNANNAYELGARVRGREEEGLARERDLGWKMRKLAEELTMSDVVVKEYAALVRKMQARSSTSASSIDEGEPPTPNLVVSLESRKAEFERIVEEYQTLAEASGKKLDAITYELDLAKLELDAERNMNKALAAQLALTRSDLEKLRLEDNTAAKMVSRYMQFSQTSTNKLLDTVSSLQSRHASTLSTLSSQNNFLSVRLRSLEAQNASILRALDELGGEILKESYGRRREVMLRIRMNGREYRIVEGLRRWVRRADEMVGRIRPLASTSTSGFAESANHGDMKIEEHVLLELAQQARILLSSLDEGILDEETALTLSGAKARQVSINGGLERLLEELRVEKDKRIALEKEVAVMRSGWVDKVGISQKAELTGLPPTVPDEPLFPSVVVVDEKSFLRTSKSNPAPQQSLTKNPPPEVRLAEPRRADRYLHPANGNDKVVPEETPAIIPHTGSGIVAVADSIQEISTETLTPTAMYSIPIEQTDGVGISSTNNDKSNLNHTSIDETSSLNEDNDTDVATTLSKDEQNGPVETCVTRKQDLAQSTKELQPLSAPLLLSSTVVSSQSSVLPSEPSETTSESPLSQSKNVPLSRVVEEISTINDIVPVIVQGSASPFASPSLTPQSFISESLPPHLSSSPSPSPSPPPTFLHTSFRSDPSTEPSAHDSTSEPHNQSEPHPLLLELARVNKRYDSLQKSFRDCHLALEGLKVVLGQRAGAGASPYSLSYGQATLTSASLPPSSSHSNAAGSFPAEVLRAALARLDDYTEDARVELEIRIGDEAMSAKGWEALLSVPGALVQSNNVRRTRIDSIPSSLSELEVGADSVPNEEILFQSDVEEEIKAFIAGTDPIIKKSRESFERKLEDVQHDIAILKRVVHDPAFFETLAPGTNEGTTSSSLSTSMLDLNSSAHVSEHSATGWTSWIRGNGSSRPYSPAPTFGSIMTSPRSPALRHSSSNASLNTDTISTSQPLMQNHIPQRVRKSSFFGFALGGHDGGSEQQLHETNNPLASLGLKVPMPSFTTISSTPTHGSINHGYGILSPTSPMGPASARSRTVSSSMYMLGLSAGMTSPGLGVGGPRLVRSVSAGSPGIGSSIETVGKFGTSTEMKRQPSSTRLGKGINVSPSVAEMTEDEHGSEKHIDDSDVE